MGEPRRHGDRNQRHENFHNEEREHIRGGQGHRPKEFEAFMEKDDLPGLMSRCGHYLYHHPGRRRGQGKILRILSQKEEMTQKELQDILEIRPGSMSEIISKLECRGMLERIRDEKDKRKIILRITEEGKLEGSEKTRHEIEQELFRALSEEEQSGLRALLKKLLDDWYKKEEE
ncbi:MAG TPA: MarR family transcriptional regulator [Candidatus Pelethocola excrementipullorum]|nr:MarR family transcriptional regulator [Candidatus Pelethocola excrementipullorum]